MPPTPDEPRARAGPPVLSCGPLTEPSLPVRWAMIWIADAAPSPPDQAVIERALSQGYDLGRRFLATENRPVEICRPEEVDLVAASLAGLVLEPESWHLITTLTPDAKADRDRLIQRLVESAPHHPHGPRPTRLRALTSFCVKLGQLLALAEHDIGSVGPPGRTN